MDADRKVDALIFAEAQKAYRYTPADERPERIAEELAGERDAERLPCGHPKSDETSADHYTFCAVCAVGGAPDGTKETP